MATLTDLGFSIGLVVETIVSTYDDIGIPNAAPMGVMVDEEDRLVIKIFNSSTTLRNLKSNKSAVLNLTSDINAFYKTAFKEANPQGSIPKTWFEKAQNVTAPKMSNAEAIIEVIAVDFKQIDIHRTLVVCQVKGMQSKEFFPKAYNRAFSATLEAIILSTRIKAFSSDKSKGILIVELKEMINNCHDVVSRTAPQSRYAEIMAELQKRVELWTAKK